MQAESPVLLVVEDDFLVRLTLVDALSDDGFTVLEAADATEALSLICDRRDIAAMLTDINLPGGADGFALARAVRVIRPEMPVVYASGRYSGASEEQSVGGARFLAKPFTPTFASEVIRDLINGRTRPAPVTAPKALDRRV